MEKVSVIMPCFNDGLYINDSINSVRAQTYQNIELVIVNDGSTDQYTLDVLNHIEKNEKIKIVHTAKLGPAGARNAGINASEGKYILPLDSDDTISSSYIAKAVSILEQGDHIGVVYCEADLFGEKSGKWDLPSYSLNNMLLDNIVFVSALFRKADWDRVGGFSEDFTHGMEDYDFWLSIMELNKEIIQIPEILFHYRIKNISRTTDFNNNINIVKKTYHQLYDRHKDLYKKNIDIYALVMRDALIDKIFDNRILLKSIDIVEFLNKYPRCKKILRKIASLFMGVTK